MRNRFVAIINTQLSALSRFLECPSVFSGQLEWLREEKNKLVDAVSSLGGLESEADLCRLEHVIIRVTEAYHEV
jgi:hypothetical protein